MAGNYQTTPVGESLSRAMRETTATSEQQSGKSYPVSVVSVSGQFLTVKYEVNPGTFTLQNVTIPVQSSPYDWIPYQVGDVGVVQPADVHLAGINGTGGATPGLVQSANLTALSFTPIAKKTATVPDPNQRVVQGPTGVLLRNTGATSTIDLGVASIGVSAEAITLSATTSITFTCGGHNVVISAAGVVIDGIIFGTHQHTLVTTGTSDSGPPI